MELSAFLSAMAPEEREAFAIRVGTTLGHLNNVAYKQRTASASLAMQIELCSEGKVTRATLRPKDWHLIWPPQNQMVEAGIVSQSSPGTGEARRTTQLDVDRAVCGAARPFYQPRNSERRHGERRHGGPSVHREGR